MVLAGCARHAENWEREGFRSVHLFFQSRGVACLGQGGHGQFNRRSVLGVAEAVSAHANLFNLQPASGGQCLADAANAGAAVHVVDPKREFRHLVFHPCSMITRFERVQEPDPWAGNLIMNKAGRGLRFPALATKRNRKDGARSSFGRPRTGSSLAPNSTRRVRLLLKNKRLQRTVQEPLL